MTYNSGSATRISGALKYAREHSFTGQYGDRANAPNIVILLTDGQGKDPYRTQYEGKLVCSAKCNIISNTSLSL